MSHSDPREKDHGELIRGLATQFKRDESQVASLWQYHHQELKRDAKCLDYLGVFVQRRVKEALTQVQGDARR